MKKILLSLCIIGTLASPVNIQAKSHTRTTTGHFITSTVIKTKDGNIWKVSKRFKKGKKYRVTFDTRNTKTKKDDIIIRIF